MYNHAEKRIDIAVANAVSGGSWSVESSNTGIVEASISDSKVKLVQRHRVQQRLR